MPAIQQDVRDRLIVALDFPSAAEALDHVDRLEGRCRWFKVGLELFLAGGATVVSRLRERGFEVFLDLKLHDIPNTVAGAIRAVSPLGASLLTVHAAGGEAMLAAAAEAAAATPDSPKLLAVTVLTSMDAAQLAGIGVVETPGAQVLRLAGLARTAGIDGLVSSSDEVRRIRVHMGEKPLLVIPGIRSSGAEHGDQRRVATPAAAIANGASMLVVGRPITQARDPGAAVDAILAEMADAGMAVPG